MERSLAFCGGKNTHTSEKKVKAEQKKQALTAYSESAEVAAMIKRAIDFILI